MLDVLIEQDVFSTGSFNTLRHDLVLVKSLLSITEIAYQSNACTALVKAIGLRQTSTNLARRSLILVEITLTLRLLTSAWLQLLWAFGKLSRARALAGHHILITSHLNTRILSSLTKSSYIKSETC